MYKRIVIGVDQSYTRTGISICADGQLLRVSSINYKGCNTKTSKRKCLGDVIYRLLIKAQERATETQVICERIRTFSHGEAGQQSFMNMNYIKATAALIAVIVDTAAEFGVEVYSVDTRSWKAQVVGTTKAKSGDKKGFTLDFVKELGFDVGKNDDAADSACISLYGFIPKKRQSLKLEE